MVAGVKALTGQAQRAAAELERTRPIAALCPTPWSRAVPLASEGLFQLSDEVRWPTRRGLTYQLLHRVFASGLGELDHTTSYAEFASLAQARQDMLIALSETDRRLRTIALPFLGEQIVIKTTDADRMRWQDKLYSYRRQHGLGATTIVAYGEGTMYGVIETIARACLDVFPAMDTLAISVVCNCEAMQIRPSLRRLYVGEPLTERLFPPTLNPPLLSVLVIDHTSHLDHVYGMLRRTRAFGTQSLSSKHVLGLAQSDELTALSIRACDLHSCIGDAKTPTSTYGSLRSLTILNAPDGLRLRFLPPSLRSVKFVWRSGFWHADADWRSRSVANVARALERLIRLHEAPKSLESVTFVDAEAPTTFEAAAAAMARLKLRRGDGVVELGAEDELAKLGAVCETRVNRIELRQTRRL